MVDIFDLHLNTWKTASLSHPCAYLRAMTVGNIVLFAGGFDGISVSSVMDIYNATFNTWNVTNLFQPYKWVAATMVLNLAIFGGGDAGPARQNPFLLWTYTTSPLTSGLLPISLNPVLLW